MDPVDPHRDVDRSGPARGRPVGTRDAAAELVPADGPRSVEVDAPAAAARTPLDVALRPGDEASETRHLTGSVLIQRLDGTVEPCEGKGSIHGSLTVDEGSKEVEFSVNAGRFGFPNRGTASLSVWAVTVDDVLVFAQPHTILEWTDQQDVTLFVEEHRPMKLEVVGPDLTPLPPPILIARHQDGRYIGAPGFECGEPGPTMVGDWIEVDSNPVVIADLPNFGVESLREGREFVFLTAQDHAWTRATVDHLNAVDRQVVLPRAGSLEVNVGGEIPDWAELFVRVEALPSGATFCRKGLHEEPRLRFDRVPYGEYEVTLEAGFPADQGVVLDFITVNVEQSAPPTTATLVYRGGNEAPDPIPCSVYVPLAWGYEHVSLRVSNFHDYAKLEFPWLPAGVPFEFVLPATHATSWEFRFGLPDLQPNAPDFIADAPISSATTRISVEVPPLIALDVIPVLDGHPLDPDCALTLCWNHPDWLQIDSAELENGRFSIEVAEGEIEWWTSGDLIGSGTLSIGPDDEPLTIEVHEERGVDLRARWNGGAVVLDPRARVEVVSGPAGGQLTSFPDRQLEGLRVYVTRPGTYALQVTLEDYGRTLSGIATCRASEAFEAVTVDLVPVDGF